MTCKNTEKNMIFLAGGNLEASLSKAMNDHFADCEHCRHVYSEIQKTLEILNKPEPVRIDPWFAGRVEARLEQLQQADAGKALILKPNLARLILVAASLIIALWLGILIGSNLPMQTADNELEFNSTGSYDALLAEDLYQESIEAFFFNNGDK